MKKIAAIIMLIVCIASFVSAPALAGVMIVSNTATYDNSVAMQRKGEMYGKPNKQSGAYQMGV